MTSTDYMNVMQGLSQTEAAIARMWTDADGPTRVSLAEAVDLITRARSRVRRAAEKADKSSGTVTTTLKEND